MPAQKKKVTRKKKAAVKATPPAPVGRPTKYRETYCTDVIDHMSKGGHLQGFAGKIRVNEDTIHEWVKRHPEFSESVKVGRMAAERYYVDMGKALMAGQLNRVVSEKLVVNPATGTAVLHPLTGEPMFDRVYGPVKGNATVFIWLCKNILKWRDVQEHQHSGVNGGPIETLSIEATEAKIAELRARREAAGDD